MVIGNGLPINDKRLKFTGIHRIHYRILCGCVITTQPAVGRYSKWTFDQ